MNEKADRFRVSPRKSTLSRGLRTGGGRKENVERSAEGCERGPWSYAVPANGRSVFLESIYRSPPPLVVSCRGKQDSFSFSLSRRMSHSLPAHTQPRTCDGCASASVRAPRRSRILYASTREETWPKDIFNFSPSSVLLLIMRFDFLKFRSIRKYFLCNDGNAERWLLSKYWFESYLILERT